MANESDSGRKDCVDGKVGEYNTKYHEVPEFPYEMTCEIQECVFMDSGELSKNNHIMQRRQYQFCWHAFFDLEQY